jgi:hypothetical protein
MAMIVAVTKMTAASIFQLEYVTKHIKSVDFPFGKQQAFISPNPEIII